MCDYRAGRRTGVGACGDAPFRGRRSVRIYGNARENADDVAQQKVAASSAAPALPGPTNAPGEALPQIRSTKVLAVKSAQVIRHIAFEDLGAFEAPLADAGYAIRYCDVGVDDLGRIDADTTDLLVVLGGPIAAYAESAYPFLTSERRLIARRLARGRPTIGICLGAQLIASAAGSRVYPSGGVEIGFAPITLTPAGRASCLAAFDDDPMTLHWHGDTFDLPRGAERLASTTLCENQAFAIGRNVIGFQFHPEADAHRMEQWLIGHAVELAAAGIDIPELRIQAQHLAPGLTAKAAQVVETWLSQLDD